MYSAQDGGGGNVRVRVCGGVLLVVRCCTTEHVFQETF